MSKTERALDGEEVALDELDDFVAAEAAAADRAIDDLIDDAVTPRSGNGSDAGDDVDPDEVSARSGNGSHAHDVIGGNGFDTSEQERPTVIPAGVDTGEVDRPAEAATAGLATLEQTEVANGAAGSQTGLAADTDSVLDTSELDVSDGAPDSLETGEIEAVVDVAELEADELEADEATAVDELDTLDELGADELEVEDSLDTAEFERAVEPVEETADAEAPNEELGSGEFERAVEPSDGADDVEFELLHLESPVEDLDDDEDGDHYELPEIIPATDDVVDGSDAEGGVATAETTVATPPGPAARVGEVSEDILEELRRADIDGPIVEFAPQDDTTSARRRPKRRPDYDPAPVPIPARPPRLLGRKPRVRKVTRVVRHVDPWSVFKIAVVANLVLYAILLTAGVLLWNVAYATGTVDNVERFFESFGWSSFEFNGGEIYHASWIMGLFAVVGLTGMAVLAATLFNLITDIVGGMRFTVLEEEVVETRTSPMRRFVVRRPEPEVPAVIRDSSGAMIREAVVDDSGAIER